MKYFINLLHHNYFKTPLVFQFQNLHSLISRGIDPNLPEDEINKLLNRPMPFPYRKWTYNHFWTLFDSTIKRWDDNTKLIAVDGNLMSGKSTFAKELAKSMGMKYYPEISLDSYYIRDSGFDLRFLNKYLPFDFHQPPGVPAPDLRDIYSMDMDDFWKDPTHQPTNAKLLLKIMYLKFVQLIDALEHIFNTGQGCVIDTSFHADFVFQKAICDMGWLSQKALKCLFAYRNIIFDQSVFRVNYPHLVIYLDVPYDICYERIKAKAPPLQANSLAFLSKDFLRSIEETLKKQYIPDVEHYSEVVVYDWSEYGIADWVVDDLEYLDLEFNSQRYNRFRDWFYHSDRYLKLKRRIIPKYRRDYYQFFFPYEPTCDDFNFDVNHLLILQKLVENNPGIRTYHDGNLKFINDRLPGLRAKREEFIRIMNDPTFKHTIHERVQKSLRESFVDREIDHL